jgi:hypothetical protein
MEAAAAPHWLSKISSAPNSLSQCYCKKGQMDGVPGLARRCSKSSKVSTEYEELECLHVQYSTLSSARLSES